MARAVADGGCDWESDELMLIREDDDLSLVPPPPAFRSLVTAAPGPSRRSVDGRRIDALCAAGVARCRCVVWSTFDVRNLTDRSDDDDGDRSSSTRFLDESRFTAVSRSFSACRSGHGVPAATSGGRDVSRCLSRVHGRPSLVSHERLVATSRRVSCTAFAEKALPLRGLGLAVPGWRAIAVTLRRVT